MAARWDAHCFTFSPSASLRLFLAASNSLTYVAIAAEHGGAEAAKRRKARRSVTSGEGRRACAGAEGTPPPASRAEPKGAERVPSGPLLTTMPGLLLGDEAPDFEADTTQGRIRFHDFLGDS